MLHLLEPAPEDLVMMPGAGCNACISQTKDASGAGTRNNLLDSASGPVLRSAAKPGPPVCPVSSPPPPALPLPHTQSYLWLILEGK